MSSKSKINQNLLLILLMALITGVTILTSFQPVWANVPINALLPLAILLFYKKMVFFERLKLSTLVIMRAMIVLAVFSIMPGQTYVTIVLIFLAINILEATLTDLKKKKYWNVITGAALAVSIIPMTGLWIQKSAFTGIYEATYATVAGTVCWIIAYTIWNWVFVTNEFSDSIAKYHVAILAAPLIGSVIFMNPGFWLVFRANSLTFGGSIQITQKEKLEKSLNSGAFTKFVNASKKSGVQIALMVINLALIAVAVFM